MPLTSLEQRGRTPPTPLRPTGTGSPRRRSYARNLRLHVVPALGHKRLQQLRPSDLSGLYARLLEDGRADHAAGKGLSPRTVRYIHTGLRKCLQSAVDEEGLLHANPADKAKAPKVSASGDKHTKVSYWTGD